MQTENPLDIHSAPGQHWGEGGIDTTSQTPRKEGTLCTQWHQLTHTGSDPGSGKDSGGRGISRVLPERRWKIHALSSFSAPVKETLTTQKRLEDGKKNLAATGRQYLGLRRLGYLGEYTFMSICMMLQCTYIYANRIFVCLCM